MISDKAAFLELWEAMDAAEKEETARMARTTADWLQQDASLWATKLARLEAYKKKVFDALNNVPAASFPDKTTQH
jgi:hypothetical protein